MIIKGKDLQVIKEIIKIYPYSFYIYMPEAKSNHPEFSDIALCIIDETAPLSLITELKEKLEEANLPIKINTIPWVDGNDKLKNLTILQANPNFIKSENNLVSKFTYLPRVMGYPVIDNGFAYVSNCNLNSTMFNTICSTKLNVINDKKIQEIIDQYNNNPFSWWVGPSDTPADLGLKLEQHGFRKETEEYVMFYKLDGFDPFELDRKITIEQVRTRKQIDDFLMTLTVYDENVREFFNDKIISPDVLSKNPLFVSYLEGQPVGNGSLHFNEDVAGIYDIITSKNLRGLGIGTNMMKYLINFIHKKGYKEVYLSTSSALGFRIYSKLGFRIVGLYGYYEWSTN